MEPIISEWESFAKSIWPGSPDSRVVLRDHAEEMLRAVAQDMESSQTENQQEEKSKGHEGGGHGDGDKSSEKVDKASNQHALSRLASGFEMRGLVAEYRALRASVLKLWNQDSRVPGANDAEDIIRFNEGIDQLLTESVASFTSIVDSSRDCFLGILGHDLRNPLASATMSARLLAESKTLQPTERRIADLLCGSLEVMNLLIHDLLDFAGNRLGSKIAVFPKPMNLHPLCQEVVIEMQNVHPSRNFVFNLAGDVDLRGEWDRARLRQIISNLMGNAVQHGHTASAVTLTATSTPGDVHLTFHNRGNTIPREMIEAIFNPMKRHQPVENSVPIGSLGLGLYIAREIALAHGGSISVTSEDEETVFTVQLPRYC